MSFSAIPASVRGLFGVTLALCAITLVYTWPAARHLDTQILGGPGDGPMFLWNTWWAPHAVFGELANPLRTNHLFYPDGVSLVINTHHVLPSLLSAPLQWLFGLVPAYNLMILLSYVLSGLATFLLARDLLDDRRAAFVAALIFAFGHSRSSAVPFFNLVQTWLVVFFIWALWRAWRESSWHWAAGAGVFVAALVYTSYNLLAFAFVFSLFFVVYSAATTLRRRESMRPLLVQWSAVLLVAAVLAAPLLVELSREIEENGVYSSRTARRSYDEAVALERLLVRGPLDAEGLPIRQASYLGLVALLLGAWGVVTNRREPALWLWLSVFCVFMLMSLGPRLNLAGDSLAGADDPTGYLTLPFAWVYDTPFLREIRTAHRYALVGSLALSIVAGYGARALLSRFSGDRRLREAVFAGGCLLVVVDFADLPFQKLYRLPEPPAALETIAGDTRDVSVFEFPAGRRGYTPFSWFQTIHGKPVYLDGELARTPPRIRERQATSTLRRVFETIERDGPLDASESSRLRDELRREARENRIGWILLAWADRPYLLGRRSGLLDAARLEAMDRLVRETFDVEQVVLDTPLSELERRQALPWREGRSISALYRIYRIGSD